MPVATDDVRHFETAADLSPEDSNQNLEYFREQGNDADYEGAKPPEPEPKTEPAAAAEPAETPAAGSEAVSTETEHEVDPESRGEWQTAKNDGERLGRLARKTKQINELKSTVSQKDGQIDELRRQLAEKEKSPSPAAPSTSLTPPKEAPKAEPAKAKVEEPAKAKEFDKPRPVRPKFEDFAATEDPIAAHADAVAEQLEKLQDWNDEKREFDTQQKAAVQREADQAARVNTSREELNREIEQRLTAARTAHPDFDEVTNNKFTPVLSYVLRESLPDGFDIGYELAKPENAAVLAELRKTSQHTEGESQRSIEKRITQATYDIALFHQSLKTKKAETAKIPPQTPPTSEASEPQPAEVKPPKTAQPRREEATPAPVRSRGAAAEKLEDIPPEDYDRRRKWRETHGDL